MTYDEAIAYIRANPAQFTGFSEDEVMSRVQSSNDANYYDPTMFDPGQKATVAKPNTATRGATVSYGTPAPKPAGPKPAAAPAAYQASVTQGMFGNFSAPTLPIMLSVGLLALGAGMAVYRATK